MTTNSVIGERTIGASWCQSVYVRNRLMTRARHWVLTSGFAFLAVDGGASSARSNSRKSMRRHEATKVVADGTWTAAKGLVVHAGSISHAPKGSKKGSREKSERVFHDGSASMREYLRDGGEGEEGSSSHCFPFVPSETS